MRDRLSLRQRERLREQIGMRPMRRLEDNDVPHPIVTVLIALALALLVYVVIARKGATSIPGDPVGVRGQSLPARTVRRVPESQPSRDVNGRGAGESMNVAVAPADHGGRR
jgi:hypothetical protein